MGMFAGKTDIYTRYRVRIEIRDRLMGGTPLDPEVIEGWIRKNTGLATDSEESRQMVLQTLKDIGLVDPTEISYEDAVKAADLIASTKHSVGFRRDPVKGLFLESRCVKAMLKEAASVLMSGTTAQRLGASQQQGAKNWFAEHVFIEEYQHFFGKTDPDGVHLFIGHTTGPSGPQSSLTLYEYISNPTLEFVVKVLGDGITERDWMRVWETAQDQGLGSLRSQGFGTFDIWEWELIGDRGLQTKTVDRKAKLAEAEAQAKAKAAIAEAKVIAKEQAQADKLAAKEAARAAKLAAKVSKLTAKANGQGTSSDFTAAVGAT